MEFAKYGISEKIQQSFIVKNLPSKKPRKGMSSVEQQET
jgi:hypothetical protein